MAWIDRHRHCVMFGASKWQARNRTGRSWLDGYHAGLVWSQSRPADDAIRAESAIRNPIANPTPKRIAAVMMGEPWIAASLPTWPRYYVFGQGEIEPAYALGFFAGWCATFA